MAASIIDRMWRTTAIVMCAAVPASFYVIGDLTDAFPGVLTVRTAEEGPSFGPRALAEDWERVEAPPLSSAEPGASPVALLDLQERMSAAEDLPVVAGGLAFSVVDAGTGRTLAARDEGTALVPASTLKLLTAAAVLRRYDGDEVLTTRSEERRVGRA